MDTVWLLLRKGRRDDGAKVTLGSIAGGGEIICAVAELPWLGNQRGRSCIGDGMFLIVPHPTKPKKKVRLENAPGRDDLRGRTEINGEIGNWPTGRPGSPPGKPQSKGCFFPGLGFQKDGSGVVSSEEAVARLIEKAEEAWAVGRLFLRVRWEDE